MKTIQKLFLLGISLILVIGFTNTAFSQITIKGDIIDKYKVDVIVYTYDAASEKWTQTKSLKSKLKYKLSLDPTLNHTIVFFGNNKLKTLQIKAGEQGKWFKYIDLDFNIPGDLNACLIQQDDDYLIYIVDREYSVISASR